MSYLLLICGILIRLLLIPIPGFKADVSFWKGWGLAVADKGPIWLVQNTNYNYPPAFIYILYLINKVYAVFKSPYLEQYWNEKNILYLFLFKLIIIISDVLIVYLMIKIAKAVAKPSENNGSEVKKAGKTSVISHSIKFIVPVFILAYLFNPASIFDGVIWGQVDQFGLLILLASFYFLILSKYKLASVVFTLSCLMKFQGIIFIPLFYLFIYKKHSFKGLIKSLEYSIITFLVVSSPFIVTKQIEILIRLLTQNSDYFPLYSLNALNMWWLFSGLEGMKMSDKNLFFGIVTAKQFSLLLFSFFYFIATVSLFFAKKEDLLKRFVLSCSLAVFAFFHLLTQSHERYLFHLLVFIPLLLVVDNKVKVKHVLVFFIFFSLLFFLDMYVSMGLNYPDQVYWPFAYETVKSITFYLSIAQIALFLVFFFYYFAEEVIAYKLYIGACFVLLFGVLIGKNTSYWLGRSVSLTVIPPTSASQDYLRPVYNSTLNSVTNIFDWQRLSNNYYFYQKGIASHANSEIVYNLQGKFSRFKTDYAVDTEAWPEVKVKFSIEADGREIFSSKTMGKNDLPMNTGSLNIRGVNYLVLKITNEAKTINGAHADWLGPELRK